MQYGNLINQMTLKEKVNLCSGYDYWNTKGLPRLSVPSFAMGDGPHGLRKETGKDTMGLTMGEEATCFPPACLTACSFDRKLISEMAEALGAEACSKNVQMVLGPAINIKRSPLCGRNFEYFSEDPYLAGEMGKAYIEGMQKTGVGACVKHFACNNQEDFRMTSDSIVDRRALHELYLPAFKRALGAKPAAVMCSYNLVNDVYMSDNRDLVRGLLREKWGFAGMTVTDWGAMNSRIAAFRAGVDLEMPGNRGFFDRAVMRAVKKGQLAESEIDECVDRILIAAFTLNNSKQARSYDPMEHHMLAKKIAAGSAVLLKNDEKLLPVSGKMKIAVVGSLAKHMRFQGSGSSHINPHMVSGLLDGLKELDIKFTYFKGYHMNNSTNEDLMEEAAQGCADCDAVIIAAGLTERFEAEGFDRRNMKLPEGQNRLIARLSRANSNIAVVLFGGSPVEIPWAEEVRAILHMYLPGQAGGLAAADLLFGLQNPSGKLAESYPIRYDDTPAANFYNKTGRQAQYRESVFVGYRYYDKLNKEVLFPFGWGLSYTEFEYRKMTLSKTELAAGEELVCTVLVRNKGLVAGAEVVQIYIAKPVTGPVKELAGFDKVFLEPGEEKEVSITLEAESFLTYQSHTGNFILAGGTYGILVGSSSRDILLNNTINVAGEVHTEPLCDLDSYIKGELTERNFALLLGSPIHKTHHIKKGSYTPNNTLMEMKDTWITRLIVWLARMVIRRSNRLHEDHPLFMMMMDVLINMPVGRFPLMTGKGFPGWAVTLLLNIENGRFWFAKAKQGNL
ncbi:MAG: glycoside hydrolase family 3 C-terminal domain-containing protein [Eubacteriales bacterium]